VRSVELFAGAGGLAIGMANAGFRHTAVVERDHFACETFRENQRHHAHAVEGWPLYEIDARQFDYSTVNRDVWVVSGGPPCQPFSAGGKHQGQRDDRNMFPEAVRAVRELVPKAFIFENVKGLARESFSSYFSHILLQLQYPELERRKGENWIQHRSRLEQHHTANKEASTYNVIFDVLNAADYGIPQKRERVFIVGFRSDLGVRWSFPVATHSQDALLSAQWIEKDYWDEHSIGRARRPRPTAKIQRRIELLRANPQLLRSQRWRTVRDAISDLPDPEILNSHRFSNHVFTPGARTYAGHTGSTLDLPSKTLKAGAHGVPGGENMFYKDNGKVRYFTVREAARLQTFPDEYEFPGSWSQTMRQLGNAVPVRLAQVVAQSVADSLCTAK
jgi:DNA (cytosine-5)-methyltransferase 1